jgi:glycosyltransferase involved in cell wall biosynthesis
MKILFVSPVPLDRKLGAAKVVIELADELRATCGWSCDLLSPVNLGMPSIPPQARCELRSRVRDYLIKHGGGFDVIDVDHELLPFERNAFSRCALIVARSVLLVQHLEHIKVPQASGLRASFGRMLFGRQRAKEVRDRITTADQTMNHADLVNVSNQDDKHELVRRGISAEKIVVLPFGIDVKRREMFDTIPLDVPPRPVVAFVGSFDLRKGASDFAAIFQGIRCVIPEARLKLLGTRGLLHSAVEVLRYFPADLRSAIEIQETYEPEELPSLLADCSVGVFPSYYEGFGFGLLEMLAAGLPVIAYDAPGPGMMLAKEQLVPPGDTRGMADRIVRILREPALLRSNRAKARASSRAFDWRDIARATASAYERAIEIRKISARKLVAQ